MSILANNVRLIRKELRCTQSAMAEILGIGFRSYVRYEAGKKDAPVSVLVKLARLGNILLEQMLTQVISSHDISPAQIISKTNTSPETKLVDFCKGEVVFKKPTRQELITIDSSEKRLLALFRKMDVNLQRVCVKNIQEVVKKESPAPPLRALTAEAVKKRLGRPVSKFSKLNNVAKKRDHLDRKRANKKLLKEKIDRLKMIANSISKTTVK